MPKHLTNFKRYRSYTLEGFKYFRSSKSSPGLKEAHPKMNKTPIWWVALSEPVFIVGRHISAPFTMGPPNGGDGKRYFDVPK